MKKLIIILIAASPFLTSSKCSKDGYRNAEAVRLMANLNTTVETISLGDTLKITLTIPGTVVTESSQNIIVNSLEEGSYSILCARIDTVNKRKVYLNNTPAFFVTQGTYNGAAVFISNNISPYRAVLNIVPPEKGVYYIEASQIGKLHINNNDYYGLKVNFNAADKHWNMLAYYYNVYFNTTVNEYLASAQYFDNEGYGLYGFRVD